MSAAVPRLSAVVTTFQVQALLPRCLASLAGTAGEVVVVDGGSRDRTVEIARAAGARLLAASNPPMLNRNKNLGFEACRGEWLLSLDSDEELSPALARQIAEATGRSGDLAGYWLPRRHLLLGRPVRGGPWGLDRQLRLFRRGRGRFPCADIHETLALDGPAGELSAPLLHHRPPDLASWRRRILHYSRFRARRYLAEGRPFRPWKALGGPPRAVLESLFRHGGLADGLAGLFLAGTLGLEALCDHLYHLRLLLGAGPARGRP